MTKARRESGARGRDPVTQHLLDILYQARKARGWTVRDLAERAAISPSYVSLIENGHKIPDASTIERIGRALGIDQKLLNAWVTVRGRSADTGEAIEAARELVEQLGLSGGGTGEEGEWQLDQRSDAAMPMAMPSLMASAAPAGPGSAGYPELRMREELRAELPDADRYVIGIPVVEEGTEPVPGEAPASDRRPLWIDRRSLPERDELRGAWAWRLSSKGIERVRGIYRRGDMVVISPLVWSPDNLDPHMVFAVREKSRVVLSRLAWTGREVVLLPGRGAPPLVIEARDERGLADVIAGRVILAVQRFR
jgi:transcriptional regulator with XRE-family HTH domain